MSENAATVDAQLEISNANSVVSDLPAVDVLTESDRIPDTLLQPAPPTELLVEVRRYYELLQIDYTRRAAEIEKFLGFAESSEALGTRLHKVEMFLGVK